ncbi:MAG: hypothetical protein AB7S26_38085 [Sandaracinaceae bacterium]
MAGQVLELIPRTNFDFTFLGSGSQTRVLVGLVACRVGGVSRDGGWLHSADPS